MSTGFNGPPLLILSPQKCSCSSPEIACEVLKWLVKNSFHLPSPTWHQSECGKVKSMFPSMHGQASLIEGVSLFAFVNVSDYEQIFTYHHHPGTMLTPTWAFQFNRNVATMRGTVTLVSVPTCSFKSYACSVPSVTTYKHVKLIVCSRIEKITWVSYDIFSIRLKWARVCQQSFSFASIGQLEPVPFGTIWVYRWPYAPPHPR